jgi:hypothetical protein
MFSSSIFALSSAFLFCACRFSLAPSHFLRFFSAITFETTFETSPAKSTQILAPFSLLACIA